MAPFTVIGKRLISRLSLLAACAAAALFLVQCGGGGDATVFVKEPLPYSQDALAPFISADTMGFHYDKHYAGYVNNANRLIRGIGPAGNTPEAVIRMTAGDASRAAIFNNAAQAWNHAYFFKCLKPDGGGAPEGLLAEMIDASFGSFTDFKALFSPPPRTSSAAAGSGWCWTKAAWRWSPGPTPIRPWPMI